ncbi:cystinosin homolog [Fagus crenata]
MVQTLDFSLDTIGSVQKKNLETDFMASWNSIPLEITYQVLGWTAFTSWTIGFYPQVILNFRKKSVVGLSFDFVVLNLTKHSSYLIYNASLYFSSTIQKQYYEKYGYGQMIPVAANDVAFSTHAVLVTAIILFQILIYDRGSQKVSKIAIAIVCAVWLFAAVCFFIALPSHSWLWLISIFNSIQVFMAVVKYIPQAFMNFTRKSTAGFSIGIILLDFTGGVTNYAQMTVQSIDQGSWVNFYGNIGKMLLSLVSIFFDIIFMCQRFVLYPNKKAEISTKFIEESTEPLVKTSDHSQPETV